MGHGGLGYPAQAGDFRVRVDVAKRQIDVGRGVVIDEWREVYVRNVDPGELGRHDRDALSGGAKAEDRDDVRCLLRDSRRKRSLGAQLNDDLAQDRHRRFRGDDEGLIRKIRDRERRAMSQRMVAMHGNDQPVV